MGMFSRGHRWWGSLSVQIIDDSSRAGQAQVAPVMVDTFHFPLAGLRNGQALIYICGEGPAGHSQSPRVDRGGQGRQESSSGKSIFQNEEAACRDQLRDALVYSEQQFSECGLWNP